MLSIEDNKEIKKELTLSISISSLFQTFNHVAKFTPTSFEFKGTIISGDRCLALNCTYGNSPLTTVPKNCYRSWFEVFLDKDAYNFILNFLKLVILRENISDIVSLDIFLHMHNAVNNTISLSDEDKYKIYHFKQKSKVTEVMLKLRQKIINWFQSQNIPDNHVKTWFDNVIIHKLTAQRLLPFMKNFIENKNVKGMLLLDSILTSNIISRISNINSTQFDKIKTYINAESMNINRVNFNVIFNDQLLWLIEMELSNLSI